MCGLPDADCKCPLFSSLTYWFNGFIVGENIRGGWMALDRDAKAVLAATRGEIENLILQERIAEAKREYAAWTESEMCDKCLAVIEANLLLVKGLCPKCKRKWDAAQTTEKE